ncbi:MAG TPA: cytochrome c biogenesis protein CcdA [Actinomycetota bacterium]|nr:cytochrome c biogenesis protein CcdA [Actinomycetota bacterium]
MLGGLVDTGLSSWWAPALAFAAGVVSFASPCVLPLVPGYLSIVTGGRATEGEGRRPIVPILLFIMGFTIVFTLAGAFAGSFVRFFRDPWFQRIAGALIVALGLLMLGYAFRRGSPGLYSERRPFLERLRPGTVGALPLGMAFAAGWTPCIGPVLGGILAIATAGGTARGAGLLFAYSLGLGLPFLLVGLGADRLMGALGRVRRHYRAVAGISGAMLVVAGILVATGVFHRIFVRLAPSFVPSL